MTKREEARAELDRLIQAEWDHEPGYYDSVLYRAVNAFERAVRDEEAEEIASLCMHHSPGAAWVDTKSIWTRATLESVITTIRARIAARNKEGKVKE